MNNIRYTIFTGTYNSERIIGRVIDSIKSQILKEFEWIVIDDCSTDNTIQIIKEFKEQNPDIIISIIKHKINTGVAISRKEALERAKGKYFITWDHDDIQSPKQIEIFDKLWKKHDDTNMGNIFAKMKDQHGKLLGKKFPSDPYFSNYIASHNTFLVGNSGKGNVVEHHVCCKTEKYLEVLNFYKNHPNLLQDRLPNGGDVWGMMAYLGYKTIYTNSPVRTYYINEQGRTSMSSSKRKDGAERILRNKLLWVNFFDKKLSMSEWKFKLRNVFAVTMYGFLAKKSLSSIVQEVQSKTDKLLVYLFSAPAKVLANKYAKE